MIEVQSTVARLAALGRVCVVAWLGWAGAGAPTLAMAQAGGQAGAQVSVPAGALPRAELFYQRPAIEAAALSPSGRWLAMGTRGPGGRTALLVFDLQAWKPLGVAARFADADIGSFQWVNDERLVFGLTDRTRGGGVQEFSAGLFGVKRDGSALRQLIRTRDTEWYTENRRTGVEVLTPDHRLLQVPNVSGDEVIVGQDRVQGGEFAGIVAKRLNVETGRTTNLSERVPLHANGWWFTPAGEPRAVLTVHQGRAAFHWREPGADAAALPNWRVLAEAPTFAMPFIVNHVDGRGGLYVTRAAGPAGESVLHRFNFELGRPEAEPLVSTPGFDYRGSVIEDPADGRALGVRVVTDAETTVWFDAAMKAVQEEADRRQPGYVNQLQCRPCSGPGMTVLVRSASDRDPGQIWVHWPGETTAEKRWRRVGAVRPDIDPARMATTDFERIRARDGLMFPVWVTRPATQAGKAAGPRPAVVLVHGGPWVRGRYWEWSAEAQFLASRGYVVIEPEFRGSRGYGERLHRAGWKQWGQAMQDDVADALAWAVKQGDVDPQRVCIAGASYGGYATLMGLIRHPELYRCGVAWVAVTDPRLLFEWRSDTDVGSEAREFSLPLRLGDPVKDAAMLDAVTPLLHPERLRAPLLLAFGGEDRRVPLVHGTRLRKALAGVGREPQYVVYSDEGHSWLKLENKVDFATRMERFLAEHLRE